MTTAQINRRIAALKTADAINATEGVLVSRYAQILSRSWARGEITGAQMKQALWAFHTKLAAQVQKLEYSLPQRFTFDLIHPVFFFRLVFIIDFRSGGIEELQ